MRYNYLLILLFTLFYTTNLSAQPEGEVQGCHFTKKQYPLKTLTPAQEERLLISQGRSDSINLLNYNITLEIIDFTGRKIAGSCLIEFVLIEENTAEMVLDLLQLNIDSIQVNGATTAYTYDGDLITIPLPDDLELEATYNVEVFYQGTPTVAASNFGGLAFSGNIAYNLGIGLGENPYNFGRSWFPCFDNFVERATFDLNIITANGRQAYCSGHFQEEVALEDDQIMRTYRIDQPMTTYLVGIAVSTFGTVESTHTGVYGEYPIQLVGNPGDLGNMDDSFEYLGDAIDAFESWYGPYYWGRVGFVLTPVGAMEHVHNVAFPRGTGVGGPTFGMNRLMAHELAHQWWGNITTLSSPANMWIKEGNAEYGAHLFTEYVFGQEEFIQQVRDNHLLVLKDAHLDDGGFQPLSGIPYEYTYGTHTYNKGASMIHNMRTYLGDSLFSVAQSAVLQDFALSAVDAEEYRDHLSEVSGIDMTSFFNDWIFSPGHSNFELETLEITALDTEYEVELSVQQRLRGGTNLHTNVPLSVTFFGPDWQEHTAPFMTSGEFSAVTTFTVPFEPVMTVLNHYQELNLARMNRTYRLSEPGSLNTTGTGFFSLNIDEVADSALLNIVHHWTAADPALNPEDVVLSNTHYWSVQNIVPDDFSARGIIRFSGGANDLDFELVQAGTETIRLMYRPSLDSDWEQYPFVEITPFGNGGLARIDPILPGDYAFANVYNEVATTNILDAAQITVSPNPGDQFARIQIDFPAAAETYELQLYSTNGQLLRQATYPKSARLEVSWSTAELPNGTYVLSINNGSGRRAMEMVVQH
jgi:aminopeptidase N